MNVVPRTVSNSQFCSVLVTGCGDDDDLGPGFRLLNPCYCIQTVSVRQSDIEQDQIMLSGYSLAQAVAQSMGTSYGMSHVIDDVEQDIAYQPVVIDNQNAGHKTLNLSKRGATITGFRHWQDLQLRRQLQQRSRNYAVRISRGPRIFNAILLIADREIS